MAKLLTEEEYNALLADKKRIDYIESWSVNNKSRGMHWNTFCFDVDMSIRDQLDKSIDKELQMK